MKNGNTTNAGNTLVAAAHRSGRTLIVTVMNPQSGAYNAVYNEATKLLDWGFSAVDHTNSVGTLNAATPADPATAVPAAPKPPAAKPATTEARVSSRSSVASTTAWLIGGALVLTAAVCVILLRRRNASKR